MTGTECYRAALNLLSETRDTGAYYEQFALGALNQLLVTACARSMLCGFRTAKMHWQPRRI